MERAEPLTAIAATILAAAVCLSPLPLVFRAVAALALVAYLPGSCLLQALTGSRHPSLAERLSLSVALSFAVTILVGLCLDAAGHLDRTAWAIGLALFTIVVGSIAVSHRPHVIVRTNRTFAAPQRGRVATWVVAVVVAGVAIGIARHGALTQAQYAYSDFWMVPDNGPYPKGAEVGVRNAEGRPMRYQIEIISQGAMSDQFAPFTLDPGQKRTVRIALPSVALADEGASSLDADPADKLASEPERSPTRGRGQSKLRVEARLFRNGDRSNVYRRVWVALPGALTPPSVVPPDPLDTERSLNDVSEDARGITRIDAHVIETNHHSQEP